MAPNENNQARRNGIGVGVDQLVPEVLGGHQAYETETLGTPEGLPSSATGVEGSGCETVDIARKLRDVAMGVGEYRMVVVRQAHDRMNLYPVLRRSMGDAIRHDLRCRSSWDQAEATLNASTGE